MKKRLITWLINISFMLVLFGMLGHGVIPHHHHEVAGAVDVCCDSHQHDDSENKTTLPCTILSNIHFENFKPTIQKNILNLKHSNPHAFIACCSCAGHANQQFAVTKTPLFIPEAVFRESYHHSAASLRGPPLA
jgi:hypothetical protein